MEQLKEELVKKIIATKDRKEIEAVVLEAISEMRSRWICEFFIALFINKLIQELKKKKGVDTELFAQIRLLHPEGSQWDF